MNLSQLYFEMPDVMIVAINSEEAVIQINKKGAKILGHPQNKIVGRNWFDNFIPGRMREIVRIKFHQMLKGTISLERYDNPILTREGTERIMSWHNILLKDERGIITGTLSSGSDITDLKLAEKAIKESEERFRTTIENMIEGCQIIDYGWRYLYVNETVAKQGRHSKKELIGHTMMEMYPGIENTEMFSYLRDCMIKRVSHEMENEFIFADGSKGWFELRIEPVPEGILILSMDITRRKEIEIELSIYRQRLEEVIAERTAECAQINKKLTEEVEKHRKTEENMILRAAILDNAKESIFLVNAKGDFVYANKAASGIYGYSHGELLNMNFRQLVQPQESHLIEPRLIETIRKGPIDMETTHVRKDGGKIKVEVRLTPIKTKHGQFIVSVMREIAGKPNKKA
ncbi:TPA: PAS domain S-box protein [Candidatus Bathyarchaeota archaeon]|nr:PAS domain S-box protein [Candidatus Bathyarchaeota archaeon]